MPGPSTVEPRSRWRGLQTSEWEFLLDTAAGTRQLVTEYRHDALERRVLTRSRSTVPCGTPECNSYVDRTAHAVLRVTGQQRLLEENLELARSIRLRNPYVDPMSLIQVSLLWRKREGEESEELNYARAATINGIAAGLRNTG